MEYDILSIPGAVSLLVLIAFFISSCVKGTPASGRRLMAALIVFSLSGFRTWILLSAGGRSWVLLLCE